MPLARRIPWLVVALSLAACQAPATSPTPAAPPTTPPAATPLLRIDLTPMARTLPLGASVPIAAVGHYADGTSGDLSDLVTWSTSDATLATVGHDADGWRLHAGGVGTVTITAALGDLSGTAQFTIAATLDSIVIATDGLRLSPCAQRQLSAIGHFSDGSQTDLTALAEWSSSDDRIATASNAPTSRGLVQTFEAGTTTITARYAGVVGSTALTADATLPARVVINPGAMSLVAGDSAALTLSATWCDGATGDVTSASVWQSSDPEVASVSRTEGGARIVDAATAGRAMIAARYGDIGDQVALTVAPPELQSIYVSTPTWALTVGGETQFTATAVYSDGSERDVTTEVVWSSYEPDVATVSAGGLVHAVAEGSATIVAELDGTFYASGFVDVAP